jgi:hypothetical protein
MTKKTRRLKTTRLLSKTLMTNSTKPWQALPNIHAPLH